MLTCKLMQVKYSNMKIFRYGWQPEMVFWLKPGCGLQQFLFCVGGRAHLSRTPGLTTPLSGWGAAGILAKRYSWDFHTNPTTSNNLSVQFSLCKQQWREANISLVLRVLRFKQDGLAGSHQAFPLILRSGEAIFRGQKWQNEEERKRQTAREEGADWDLQKHTQYVSHEVCIFFSSLETERTTDCWIGMAYKPSNGMEADAAIS